MVPDCLYLSGSAAAIVSSLVRLRSSGDGTASETVADDPAALDAAELGFEVLSEPGAVVLAPHALASSRTERAAIVQVDLRDDTVCNSKVSPGRVEGATATLPW